MNLHQLPKIRIKAKRRGRGIASGLGKTAGRGTKGQKSRGSGKLPLLFEGGQTRWHQRVPKQRGFKNSGPATRLIKIDQVLTGSGNKTQVVTNESLVNMGLVRQGEKVKLGGRVKTNSVNIVRLKGLALTRGVAESLKSQRIKKDHPEKGSGRDKKLK